MLPFNPLAHYNLLPRVHRANRFLQNKSLWSSITENKRISCYDFLCSAFDSAVYEKNLSRALEIPTCRVIPYFKFYLDKLRIALSSSKTFSFTSGSIEEICAKVCATNLINFCFHFPHIHIHVKFSHARDHNYHYRFMDVIKIK